MNEEVDKSNNSVYSKKIDDQLDETSNGQIKKIN